MHDKSPSPARSGRCRLTVLADSPISAPTASERAARVRRVCPRRASRPVLRVSWRRHSGRRSVPRSRSSRTRRRPASHYGSAINCDDNSLDYFYDAHSQSTRQKFGLISAGGSKHHPAGEVLRKLRNRSVWPYCTNLSVVCGNNIRQMLSSATVDPQVVRWLNVYGSGTNTSIMRQPCQGDICVTIPSQGEATVSRQFDHPCAFRGDFDFISPSRALLATGRVRPRDASRGANRANVCEPLRRQWRDAWAPAAVSEDAFRVRTSRKAGATRCGTRAWYK